MDTNINGGKNNLQWNASIKILHWLLGLLILVVICLGYFKHYFPREIKIQLTDWHKSIGVLIVILMIVRLLLRFITKDPYAIGNKLEIAAAHAMHLALYVGVFAMAISGYLMTVAAGYDVTLFGWKLPNIISQSDDLKDLFKGAHKTIAVIFIALIALHFLAALKHHFIDKDDVLKRITFKK